MEHTWKIYDLKRTIADDVVTEVTYACESKHDNAGTRQIGELTVVGSIDDEGFIAYEDLTQADVLGWIDSNVDKASIETANSSSIAATITSRAARTESRGTPWD
jgi:hypothetical protein